MKLHVHNHIMAIYIQYTFPEIPSIAYKVMAGDIKQVAQWATIAHLGASIMFGAAIIDDAQWQVNLNLKQWPGTN